LLPVDEIARAVAEILAEAESDPPRLEVAASGFRACAGITIAAVDAVNAKANSPGERNMTLS
jgi:hypothetical protein